MLLEIENDFAIAFPAAPIAPAHYIKRNQFLRAQSDFRFRYSAKTLTGPAPQINSNFVDEFGVNWVHFKNRIQSCFGQQGITATGDNLIIRFIHRYETGHWYLTAQCCIMSNARAGTGPLTGKQIVDVTNTTFCFRLYDTTKVDTCSDPGLYPADYFENFYFSTTGAPIPPPPPAPLSLKDIDPANQYYVGSVLFPWQEEILQLGMDNSVWDGSGELLNANNIIHIKFASCSFEYTAGTSYANVTFPHSIVIFLNLNGRDCMLDEDHILSYRNMASDFGNLCPPNCGTAII